MALWLKNPRKSAQSAIKNSLRALGNYANRLSSPDCQQIMTFIMQNEPNFRKSQMNVNKVLTTDYEKRTLGERGKNEPKTNPIKPNFKGKKMLLLLTINGRRVSFGYYADEVEAAKAYDRVVEKHRGEYAVLNFPKK